MKALLICSRVRPGDDPVDGSVQRPCDTCRLPAWTSPASERQAQTLSDDGVEICCLDCAPHRLAWNEPDVLMELPNEEVLDEVDAVVRRWSVQ